MSDEPVTEIKISNFHPKTGFLPKGGPKGSRRCASPPPPPQKQCRKKDKILSITCNIVLRPENASEFI